MKALWTWGGTFFGHFYGDEVSGPDGRYLGEIKSDNRLITCMSKKSWWTGRFTPRANRVGFVPYVDYVGCVMYAGYEDFPSPKDVG